MEEHNTWLDVVDAFVADFPLYIALAVMVGTIAAHWILGVAALLSAKIEDLWYSQETRVPSNLRESNDR